MIIKLNEWLNYVYEFCMATDCLRPYPLGRKENVLFNDTLNTFYLRLYGVRHMVKDHSDSEKGNPLPPHRLLFPINSNGSFICTIPQTDTHSETRTSTSNSNLLVITYLGDICEKNVGSLLSIASLNSSAPSISLAELWFEIISPSDKL